MTVPHPDHAETVGYLNHAARSLTLELYVCSTAVRIVGDETDEYRVIHALHSLKSERFCNVS
jgi:hypothetical protein